MPNQIDIREHPNQKFDPPDHHTQNDGGLDFCSGAGDHQPGQPCAADARVGPGHGADGMEWCVPAPPLPFGLINLPR